MAREPKKLLQGVATPDDGAQDAGSPADQEDRANLQRWIYLMYQHQPPKAMSLDERRKHLAWMRYECERLGVKCPAWLKEWHPDVAFDGTDYAYHDPDDSPNPPPPYPEAQDLDDEAEADLAKWERKAFKAAKAGKRPSVSFESAAIPAPVASYVASELAKCASSSDVRQVFAFFD